MTILSTAEVESQLAALSDWQIISAELTKNFSFQNFVTAMRFANQVAALAEEANHHPDIDIRYNRVKISLSTHSEGGLTTKDFRLAEKIQAIQ